MLLLKCMEPPSGIVKITGLQGWKSSNLTRRIRKRKFMQKEISVARQLIFAVQFKFIKTIRLYICDIILYSFYNM